MIHIIQGSGRGKTTSSVGLAIRAAGHGLKVLFIQFLKDDSSGEVHILKTIPAINVLHSPVNYGFTFMMTESQKKETAEEYKKLMNIAISSDAYLIVLDEAIHALNAGLLQEEQMRKLLSKKAEVVLTGQNTPSWLLEMADYISDVQKIKHPYDNGIEARKGIEF